jgi:hypothetical protein
MFFIQRRTVDEALSGVTGLETPTFAALGVAGEAGADPPETANASITGIKPARENSTTLPV